MTPEDMMDLTDRAFAIYYDFAGPGLFPCQREVGECGYFGSGELEIYCGHFRRPCYMAEVPR